MEKVVNQMLIARALRAARDANWELLTEWLWRQEQLRKR